MEFYKQILNSHELVPLCTAFQDPTVVYVDQEVMEFFYTVLEKSWNFVTTISWQSCTMSPSVVLIKTCRSHLNDDTAVTCALVHSRKPYLFMVRESQCHSFKMWTSVHVTAVSSVRGLPHIFISALQMETVTKILIKMRPLSTDGAILILVF